MILVESVSLSLNFGYSFKLFWYLPSTNQLDGFSLSLLANVEEKQNAMDKVILKLTDKSFLIIY